MRLCKAYRLQVRYQIPNKKRYTLNTLIVSHVTVLLRSGLLRINKLRYFGNVVKTIVIVGGEQMHGDPKSVTFAQPVSSILELRSKRDPREGSPRKQRGGDELRDANRTICASDIETRRRNIELIFTAGRLLRIVRSSRGWLATGPKFKLHPRTESLTRAGARPRHHAGANFSQVLRCPAWWKIRMCFRAESEARRIPRYT